MKHCRCIRLLLLIYTKRESVETTGGVVSDVLHWMAQEELKAGTAAVLPPVQRVFEPRVLLSKQQQQELLWGWKFLLRPRSACAQHQERVAFHNHIQYKRKFFNK